MVKPILAGVVAACGLLGAQPAFAAGSMTFTDPTRDSGTAPDVSTVTVTNDDAGAITIEIAFTNMPTPTADAVVLVLFDTDRNVETGDPDGMEFQFVLAGSDLRQAWTSWNGSGYATQGVLDGVSFAAGKATLHLTWGHLGGVTGFDFEVAAGNGPEGARVWDDAPDSDVWTFERVHTPVIASIRVGAAGQPRAGNPYTAPAVATVILDSGAAVAATSVRCAAKLGGKRLRGAGPRGCRFAIPKNAKGKRLVLTITVGYLNAVPKSVTFVRRVK